MIRHSLTYLSVILKGSVPTREPAPSVIGENMKHCPQGHPYDEENSYIDSRGYTHCRTCRRERMRVLRESKREVESKSGLPPKRPGWNNAAKTHCPQGHEYSDENTYNWRNSRGGPIRVCKECQKAHRRRLLLKKYSITEERFQEMLQACDNRCPGCSRLFDDLKRQPDIDHFHDCCESGSCGECVRGLLCHDCNLLIGHSSDSPATLLNLAKYLMDAEKFRAQSE